jgi:hypothetical protein
MFLEGMFYSTFYHQLELRGMNLNLAIELPGQCGLLIGKSFIKYLIPVNIPLIWQQIPISDYMSLGVIPSLRAWLLCSSVHTVRVL